MSVKYRHRGPRDNEFPTTIGYAHWSATLRGRSLVPEVPLGNQVITDSETYPGLGVKRADLAGVRPTPTLIETKSQFNSRTLYSAIGQVVVKRQLLATEYRRDPESVDARIVFDEAPFPVGEDLPPLAEEVATAVDDIGIRWIVRQGPADYVEVFQ